MSVHVASLYWAAIADWAACLCQRRTNCAGKPVAHIPNADSPLLDSLLRAQPGFDSCCAKADELNLQIIYTQIDRDAQNRPSFIRTPGTSTQPLLQPR